MNNILNKGLWIVFTVLTPLTFVGLFSQNAIPGNILYPVKIGIENTGEIAFSFTPASHASYSTALTTRRFEEATQLIVTRSDTEGLQTLIAQTEKAQKSLTQVENVEQKKAIEENLVKSIDTYQQKLTTLQKTVDSQYIAPTPTETPIPTVIIYQNYQKTQVIPTPTATPTNTPALPLAKPTLSTSNSTVQQSKPEIIDSIEDTKIQLETIKAQVQQNILASPSPTITPIPTASQKNRSGSINETGTKQTEVNKNWYQKSN